MPQIDKVTFFFQSCSIVFVFFFSYYIFVYLLLPDIHLALKQREIYLASLMKELFFINYLYYRVLFVLIHLSVFYKKVYKFFPFLDSNCFLNFLKYKLHVVESKNFTESISKIHFKILILENLLKKNLSE